MKKLLSFPAMVVFGLFFSSCTTGPAYNAIKDTFPPLAASVGRIFIYRDAIYNPGKTPAVLLNGEQTGLSKVQGFFYVDRPAGEYKVSLSGESGPAASFTLSTGQTLYVRINVHTNLSQTILYPEVVDASIAQRELVSCKYASGNSTAEMPAEPAAAANDESPAKIEIIVGQGGQISINGDLIPNDQLLPLLKKDHDRNPNIAVLIKADKSIPLQTMDDVINTCTAAGLNRFSLQTQ